jgi:hypothetical protein
MVEPHAMNRLAPTIIVLHFHGFVVSQDALETLVVAGQ